MLMGFRLRGRLVRRPGLNDLLRVAVRRFAVSPPRWQVGFVAFSQSFAFGVSIGRRRALLYSPEYMVERAITRFVPRGPSSDTSQLLLGPSHTSASSV